MKKGLLSIGLFAFLTLGMVSCGGIDGAKVGGEYCDCMKKEKEKEIVKMGEKYKDAKASEKKKKK